ncbi:MATE family efflux transporter [Paludicola sp. MB14-C6]|uniref:MATE family efflux transporter n=1 Tax=Paludihabitans sp. MB14-C6 TaxID=3070656 RepID=UPI0027DD3BE7|nr:MATE family efflux transporter [Paludicola sp. MB14-C6]WMJ24081.1 MATE family efflux transporter [Paludicola sp. MB14-C6]
MEKTFSQKLSYGGYLKFILPSILSLVFMSFYTTVDGFYVSHWIGPDALAAINIVIPVTCVSYGIAVMLAVGSGALVGIKMGEGKTKEAHQFFTFVTIALFIISIVLTIVGFVFLKDIMRLLGATDRLMPLVMQYGFWTVIITPPVMFKLYFEYYCRVDGKPKLAMTISISGLVLNIVLNYIFVAILDMGMDGVGIGTGLSIFLSGMIGCIYFLSGKSTTKFCKPTWAFRDFFSACFNGSSEMLIEMSTGITTFLFNITILKIVGENGISALSVITYLYYFFISFFFGISGGIAPLISYNYGARNFKNITRAIRHSAITLLWTSIVIFAISNIFAKPIIGIFTTDTNVMPLALNGLHLFSICFLFIGSNIYVSTHFTAIGNGKVSAILSVARSLVFVVIVILILPKLFGLNGVWLTVPVAEILTIGLSALYYYKNRFEWIELQTTI